MNVLTAFLGPPKLHISQFPTPEEAAANIAKAPTGMLQRIPAEVADLLRGGQEPSCENRLREIAAMAEAELARRANSTREAVAAAFAALDAKYLFWLQYGAGDKKIVSALAWREAEAVAGFHPKPGLGPLATGGFGLSNGVRGGYDPRDATCTCGHRGDVHGVAGVCFGDDCSCVTFTYPPATP